MSQASTQPAPTEEPQEYSTPRPSAKEKLIYTKDYIIGLLGALLPLFPAAGFGIIIWALVVFAQNGKSSLLDCTSRYVGDGFAGNSDFYGLGIRLGVYLQWWASLLANIFLPAEWYPMLSAYMIFSLALIIAVLVLTFQHACTFTAEIIIILFMYWGGIFALTYSTKFAIDANVYGESKQRVGIGLSLASIAVVSAGTAFSTWFWLRLATAGEVDFVASPGGTFYFIFGKISAQSKPAARFIVFICFYLGWTMTCYALFFLIGLSFGTIGALTIEFYLRWRGKVTVLDPIASVGSAEQHEEEISQTTIQR